jgi:hypothetical protein
VRILPYPQRHIKTSNKTFVGVKMRLISTLTVISILAMQSTAAFADGVPKHPEAFQMCIADNPKNCDGSLYLPCGSNPQRVAEVTCRKKGSWFVTLSKTKEVAGGQCGATTFGVKCE